MDVGNGGREPEVQAQYGGRESSSEMCRSSENRRMSTSQNRGQSVGRILYVA